MLPSFVDLYSLFSFSIPSPLVHYFFQCCQLLLARNFIHIQPIFPNSCRHILTLLMGQTQWLSIWEAWERARLGSMATIQEDTGLWLPRKVDVKIHVITVEPTIPISALQTVGTLLKPGNVPKQDQLILFHLNMRNIDSKITDS